MRGRLSRVALCCAVFGYALPARAGNDDELFCGNRAAMAGGAVSATVGDSSAIWYNPAGLGSVERSQIDVSGTAYTLRAYSAPRLVATVAGQSKDGSVTEFVSVPTQIAYVRKLAPAVALGLGYFVPHASNLVLRVGLATGNATNGSRSQIAASVADTQHTFAAGVGVRLTSRLRLGGSLIAGYAATTQAISVFSATQRGGETRGSSSLSVIGTASRLSVEESVGLQFDVTRRFTLGVTARAPRLLLHQSSDSIQNQSVASSTGGGAMPSIVAQGDEPRDPQGLNWLRWGRAGVAVSYRFASGWVAAEFDIQPGIHRESLGIDRRLLWNARVGFYRAVTKVVAIGAGLFTDRAPDRVKEEFLYGSGDFYGGSLGVELSNEHLLDASEPVDSLIFSTVFALRYAFSDGSMGRAVFDPDAVAAGQAGFDTAHGRLIAHEFGLYVGSGLHF